MVKFLGSEILLRGEGLPREGARAEKLPPSKLKANVFSGTSVRFARMSRGLAVFEESVPTRKPVLITPPLNDP